MTGSLAASCTDLYATATPLRQITANPDIASRGAAYGMRSVAVDGNDVVAVAEAAHAAVEAARQGLGPTLIEARTYRSQGHHTNDPVDGLYRSAEERLNWLKYAPIDRLKATLLELEHESQDVSTSTDTQTALASAQSLSGPGARRPWMRCPRP